MIRNALVLLVLTTTTSTLPACWWPCHKPAIKPIAPPANAVLTPLPVRAADLWLNNPSGSNARVSIDRRITGGAWYPTFPYEGESGTSDWPAGWNRSIGVPLADGTELKVTVLLGGTSKVYIFRLTGKKTLNIVAGTLD